MINTSKHESPYIKPFLTTVLFSIIFICMLFQNAVIYNSLQTRREEEDSRLCSCDACVRDLKDDDWFLRRFNPTVQPMMNRRNSVLNKTVFRWWKGLQVDTSKKLYTDMVDILFDLFPDEEHYGDTDVDRCRTCAVVGNSGNLLNSSYGEIIDNHDFVIRINMGPTKGYEKDVGTKTTHRIIYPESAVDLDNSTHLVFVPFKITDLQWLISIFTTKHITRTYTTVKSTLDADIDRVMIVHPAFIKYVYNNWSENHGRYPSTGFISLFLALHICDKVEVFGFGARKDGKWHHYFDQTLVHFSKGSHGGDFENKTMNELLQRNKITMYKGL